MEITTIFYFLGAALLLGGVYVAISAYLKYRKLNAPAEAVTPAQEAELSAEEKLLKQLRSIRTGDMMVYQTENYEVIGTITLKEMTWDEEDNWLATGRTFPVIHLDNNKVLASIPKGEGQDVWWFIFDVKPVDFAATRFFEGSEQNPGPAMIFADSEQVAHVEFVLPPHAEWGTWIMKDLGSFLYEATGRGFVQNKGEIRHIMAKGKANSQYLFYIDLIEGQGSSCLLVGENTKPEVMLEYVLPKSTAS